MRRWPGPEAESALVVLVPEAETLVSKLRAEYDPSAAAGVPAHITVLYPFLPPDRINEAALDRLRTCLRQCHLFDYELVTIGRFPGLVYLEPAPGDLFKAMTVRIWEAFPDCPPYGGKHPDVIPHLTVGAAADQSGRDRIAGKLALAAESVLPITARASGLALMDNSSGPWRVTQRIPFHES